MSQRVQYTWMWDVWPRKQESRYEIGVGSEPYCVWIGFHTLLQDLDPSFCWFWFEEGCISFSFNRENLNLTSELCVEEARAKKIFLQDL